MRNKIALEEHYLTPGLLDDGYRAVDRAAGGGLVQRLLDTEQLRLEAMDRNGIATCVLSHSIAAAQGEAYPGRAAALAKELNDGLAELVARHPGRFAAFASIAMHDGHTAAAELRRCVTELGFVGALLNGYQNVGDEATALYYDDLRCDPFWEAAEDLSVPVYLHPRFAPPDQQRIYEGYRVMASAAWGFGVETAGHALRLIISGVFERHPGLTMILGHLGETLPYAIGRFDQCFARDAPDQKLISQPPSHYFQQNFYVTTSGFFHTRALQAAIAELGVDRVMFSVDYPFENPDVGANWFDNLSLDPADHAKIGRDNAARLLGLPLP